MSFDIRKAPKRRPFAELEKPKEKEAQTAAAKRPRDFGPLKVRLTAFVGPAQPLLLAAALGALIFSFVGGTALRIVGAVWVTFLVVFIWLAVFESVGLSRQFVFSRLRFSRFISAVLFLAAAGLFLGKAVESPPWQGGEGVVSGGVGAVGPTSPTLAAAILALFFLSAKNYSRRALSLAITIYFLASSAASAFVPLALWLGSGAVAARLAASGWWLVFIFNFILLFIWLWPQAGRVKLFWSATLLLHLFAILWWGWAASARAFWTFPVWAALSSLAGVYIIWPEDKAGRVVIFKTERNLITKQLSFLVFLGATVFLVWSVWRVVG